MKTIELSCYGIKVTLDDTMVGFGTIESDLREIYEKNYGEFNVSIYNASIDALESLILAHAVAGVDIESAAYIEGVETAIDAIGNNL